MGGLVEIFVAEFELSAAIWGVASFSAEVVAEAALAGHLIPVGDVEPGITCSYQCAAGWGGGAGYDLKVNFGLANLARLFERLGVHTASLLDRAVRARNPQLSSAAQTGLAYLPLFLPLAYQAAFGYGVALAEAARTGATPDGQAVTRVFVRQAQTLLLQALFDLLFKRAAESPRRVAALTADEATRAAGALERLGRAINALSKADTSADDWFGPVLELLDALAGAEPFRAEAQGPRWQDSLALLWAAAVLLRRLVRERDSRVAEPARAATAPGAVAVYIADKLGRSAGVVGEAEALAYLLNGQNVWLQELRAEAPALAPVLDLIAKIVVPAGPAPLELLEALFDPRLGIDTDTNTTCILLGVVAGHELDTWMLLEPGSDGLGRAVGKEIDHGVGFTIGEDGAVDPAFLKGEVVDAEDRGVGRAGGVAA